MADEVYDETNQINRFSMSASRSKKVNIPQELPILALKDTVVYPFTVIPVFIEEERSKKAVDSVMSGNKLLGVVAKKTRDASVDPNNLYQIGTVVSVQRIFKLPERGVVVIVQGIGKIQIDDFISVDPYLFARVRPLQDETEQTPAVAALMRNIVDQTQKMISLVPYIPEEMLGNIMDAEDPLKLAYFVATMIRMKREEKQKILEISSLEEKLKSLTTVLAREIELIELGGKIQSDVQKEMGKTQREYYLREQLKAIQRELGESDEGEVDITELREQVKKAKLSKEAKEEAEKEIKRLAHIPAASPEHHVIRTYIEWLVDLPWDKSTEDKLDLAQAQKILDEDHYDLKEVKERIIEYLAVRKLKNEMKGPILCFVGPPGVGKTSLGKSIARTLGREFVRMSLGGMRDEAEIRGHRRTYVGAMPGKIIQGIKKAKSNNPVFMLDEVDKLGTDFRGDPSSALLEVLDPEQNNSFEDHYLGVSFDLSKVLFIATTNVLDTIQPALRDRMEIIRLPGYILEEKMFIAKQYLIPKQMKAHGLTGDQITFDKKSTEFLIASYTREAGVRNLERELASICRKAAYSIASKKSKSVAVTPKKVRELLGPEKVFPEVAQRIKQPGVVTGLAWTEEGGDILFIEAQKMPGKKKLILTGKLGEVMQESAKAALSYIRSQAKTLGISENFFETSDIHLHVPAGAIPKDGPSAGITMATALASLLIGKKVRSDLAMTGEITLTGQVLPIGGVKEKVLAAKRAGITHIILPKRNKNDLEKVDEVLKKGLTFHFVETVSEVLKVALEGEEPRDKR